VTDKYETTLAFIDDAPPRVVSEIIGWATQDLVYRFLRDTGARPADLKIVFAMTPNGGRIAVGYVEKIKGDQT
jgi:hypothetical protein